MNARERALTASRRQLAVDRELAAQARTKVAAGKTQAYFEVNRALEGLHASGELNGDLTVISEVLVDLVLSRLFEILSITNNDPRVVTGKMLVASEDPYAIGAALFDTTGALLVDHVDVARVDDTLSPVIAVSLAGRINLTVDRHTLLTLLDIDGAANLIVELYALATRGGFLTAFDAAVDQRTAALPQPPEGTPS